MITWRHRNSEDRKGNSPPSARHPFVEPAPLPPSKRNLRCHAAGALADMVGIACITTKKRRPHDGKVFEEYRPQWPVAATTTRSNGIGSEPASIRRKSWPTVLGSARRPCTLGSRKDGWFMVGSAEASVFPNQRRTIGWNTTSFGHPGIILRQESSGICSSRRARRTRSRASISANS